MKKLIHYQNSFKVISKDVAKDEFLVNSEVLAVDFDKFTEVSCPNGQSARSVDALFKQNENIYCFEFKNVDFDSRFGKYKLELDLKFYHTLTTLYNEGFSLEDYCFNYYIIVPEYRNYKSRNRLNEKSFAHVKNLEFVKNVKILIVPEFESLIEDLVA